MDNNPWLYLNFALKRIVSIFYGEHAMPSEMTFVLCLEAE